MDQISHLVPDSPRSIAVRVMEWMIWSAVYSFFDFRDSRRFRSPVGMKSDTYFDRYWEVRRAMKTNEWCYTGDQSAKWCSPTHNLHQQTGRLDRYAPTQTQSLVNDNHENNYRTLNSRRVSRLSFPFFRRIIYHPAAAVVENDMASRSGCDISFWLWAVFILQYRQQYNNNLTKLEYSSAYYNRN
jgi:hypothetical protein